MKTNSLDFDAQALREKILDLAMRGKLVKQDPNDEPASVLLEKIKAEKAELVKEKKIKKSKPLPEITDDEKPFDIPDSWEWVRLGEVTIFKNGKTPKSADVSDSGLYPYFKVKDMNNNELYMEKIQNYVGQAYMKQTMPKRTIIFPKNGGAVLTAKKRILIQDSLVDLNTGGIIPLNNSNYKYIFYLFSNLNVKNYVKGSAVPTINSKKLKETIVPFPPLEEQSRIAAKIAQLFALLRKVESSNQQYAKLQTLLKSKVLDLAMRGKLVKQDPNDEPASVLLEKIKVEKEQLIKEKKIKRSKPLPPITDDEKPFDIPDSWEWVRLGDVLLNTIGGGTPSKKNQDYWNGKIPWISVKDVHKDELEITETQDTISTMGVENSSTNLIKANTLIVVMRMAVGRIGVVKMNACINQDLRALITSKQFCDQYLLYIYPHLHFETSGITVKGLKINVLLETTIPLPPLSEQRRIATEITQLFALL